MLGDPGLPGRRHVADELAHLLAVVEGAHAPEPEGVGVPHVVVERVREVVGREAELRNKQSVLLHDHRFYPTPLDVAAEDVNQLRSILSDEASYMSWQGERKCGGFHPDYLAEWRAGNAKYEVLICFGCSEVQIYGPGRTLLCDVRAEVKEKTLEPLLNKYRKNRPERATAGEE